MSPNNGTSCHAACARKEARFGIEDQTPIVPFVLASAGGPWDRDLRLPLRQQVESWVPAGPGHGLAMDWLSVPALPHVQFKAPNKQPTNMFCIFIAGLPFYDALNWVHM